MGMIKPKVSVGIPVYNGAPHLQKALQCLVDQDMEELEFIICDNASTDDSAEIYQSFAEKDSRFRIYRYSENHGMGRNFTRAIEFATAPYVMWAACDDQRHPSQIRRCVETLEENPDAALAYPYTRFIDNDGNTLAEYHDPFDMTSDSPVTRYLNIIGNLGYCNALYGVFRSSMLNKTKLFAEMHIGRDAVLLTETLFYGKWIQIPEYLFYRNMHDQFLNAGNMPADVRKRRWIEALSIPPGTGITLPYLEYVYQYFQLLKVAPIPAKEKPQLIKATLDKLARGPLMNTIGPEVDRAVQLVCNNRFYEEWNPERTVYDDSPEWQQYARPFYLVDLLKIFEEILLLYPNYPGIHTARGICYAYLNRFDEAKTVLEVEMKHNPGIQTTQKLYEQVIKKLDQKS